MSSSHLLALLRKRWKGLPFGIWIAIMIVAASAAIVPLILRSASLRHKLPTEGSAQPSATAIGEAMQREETQSHVDTTEAEALYQRYKSYRQSGDMERANQVVAELEAAAHEGHTDLSGWYWLLRIYHEQGNREAREQALNKLLEQVASTPDDASAHFLLGQAYHYVGQFEQAAAEFRRVLELEPNNAAAHHNLGVIHYQLLEPLAALEEFQKALALDAGAADTHYQLGATYLALALSGSEANEPDQRYIEEAVSAFEEALRLEPNHTEALVGMGNVYLYMGEYEKAVAALKKATEKAPEQAEAYFALGEAYARMGDAPHACQAYQRFLALNPPPLWQQRAQETMETLGCS